MRSLGPTGQCALLLLLSQLVGGEDVPIPQPVPEGLSKNSTQKGVTLRAGKGSSGCRQVPTQASQEVPQE